MAVGDTGDCGSAGTRLTAALLRNFSGTVLTVGDHAYPHGSREDLRNCYDQYWGAYKSFTFPAPGNHDYETEGAAPYFEYFGANAGPSGRGYYSFRAGGWFVLSLNSELDQQGRMTQVAWVTQELRSNAGPCVLAYFHRPHVSSGGYAADRMRPLVRALDQGGVDVILNAHEHFYERFAPQDAEGRPARGGFSQFIVGTGGGRPLPAGPRAVNSEVVLQETWGMIRLTLRPSDFEWQFIQAETSAVLDGGTRPCGERRRVAPATPTLFPGWPRLPAPGAPLPGLLNRISGAASDRR